MKDVSKHAARLRAGLGLGAALLLAVTAGCGQTKPPDQPGAGSRATLVAPTQTRSPSSTPSTEPSRGSSNDGSGKQSRAGAVKGWPICAHVWHSGGHIPAHYQGCNRGRWGIKADLWGCSFGTWMTTYENRYYGVLGKVVNDAHGPLEKNKQYRHNYALCTA